MDQLKINRNGLILNDRNNCPAVSLNSNREEEIVNVRSNLTNIENNVVNNVVGSAREEEAPTENPLKIA